MKAAGIDMFGGTVRLMTVPDPRPLAPDEVLIRVMAAGVGNWDEFARVGDWDIGRRPPMALGVEAAGVITAIGESVDRWVPGDEVMTHAVPVREQGTWSEQLIASGDLLAPKPEEVGWDEAAAFSVPALTAAQALREALASSADDLLLVNGAGGVTGSMIAALARLRGLRVVATGSPTSSDRLKQLGVAAVLDYHDPDWPQAVLGLTQGAGVTAAINAAPGGEPETLRAVAQGGRLATITGAPPRPERGVSIADVYVRPDGEQLHELARLLAARELDLSIAAVHPLDGAAEALALVTSRGAKGAVVIRPSLPPNSGHHPWSRVGAPKQLDLDFLQRIRDALDINISLQGGSGTPGHYFQSAARIGVSKNNINSDMRYAYRTTLEGAAGRPPRPVRGREAHRPGHRRRPRRRRTAHRSVWLNGQGPTVTPGMLQSRPEWRQAAAAAVL